MARSVPQSRAPKGEFLSGCHHMLLSVGVDVGNLIKLKVEEAGIVTPPTFHDLCNFLWAYAFLKIQDIRNVIWRGY